MRRVSFRGGKTTKQISWLLIVLGVLLLAYSLLIIFTGNRHGVTIKNTPGAAHAAPSAVKPSRAAIANYTVPATNPKYITIPAIKVNSARVLSLGVDKTGAIATPSNIFDTGWYNQSSFPGRPGAMFIYGHVSSWQANGIFHDLNKLKAGDLITITRGDNATYTYKVVASKTYPHNSVDMNAVLSAYDAKKPGLNLMTCSGHVIKNTSEFDQRLVVFASLAQ